MDINSLPNGTTCLVDANIFIYYLTAVSADCKVFLERVARGEVEAHLTTIIVAEVLHRRMVGEAVAKGLVTPSNALNKLKANPTLIQLLSNHSTEVQKLLSLPLEVIEVKEAHIAHSHTLRQTHGLFVNDSINLACAQRLGITHDADFGRVPGINLWQPTDV